MLTLTKARNLKPGSLIARGNPVSNIMEFAKVESVELINDGQFIELRIDGRLYLSKPESTVAEWRD